MCARFIRARKSCLDDLFCGRGRQDSHAHADIGDSYARGHGITDSTKEGGKTLMSVKKPPYEEYNEAHRKASATILSKEEKEDLMKAAGRSLRGQ